jgi:sporulation protein YlmC with PRC-barrel domain
MMMTSSDNHWRNANMVRLASTAVLFALATTVASAQSPQNAQQNAPRQAGPPAQILSSVPANGMTVTHWYKQNVYDPSDSKIGEIMDVLMDKEGKATALIIGVGGFLGAGEKDVAVPFNAVQVTTKNNNKSYLVMNSTKDALKSAKGFKYDRTNMAWVPEETPSTTGAPNTSGAPNAAPPRTNPNR